MTGIVERLRDADYNNAPSRCMEAAREIERLRKAIEAIKQATLNGQICDDVAWFTPIETLHDFCDRTLFPVGGTKES
jgi:nitrogen regulatory protein PII